MPSLKKIDSRLGAVEIDPQKIIFFSRGLIGFDYYRFFVLLQIKENSPFLLLQSTEDPDFGLIVTDPFAFYPQFEFEVSKEELKVLQVKTIDQLSVLVTVTIPAGQPENTTLNLSGPILINNKQRLGMQIALTNQKITRISLKDLSSKQAKAI